ncbi:MAG: hypothetical protein ABUL62_19385 [Myxococcales bacterium]
MIFSTLLTSLGVIPELSAAARKATSDKQRATIKNESAYEVRALEEQRNHVTAKADAAIAKLEAEDKAFTLERSVSIASNVRKTVVPLFKSHHEEPTRKNTLAIRDAIKAFRARIEFELGAELDHIQIATCFAQVLIDENPDLVSVFASLDSLHGAPIEAATAVLKASDSDYLTSTEDALYALESAVEHVARTAPRDFPTDDHKQAFEVLTKYAVAADRAEAMSAFAAKTGAQREAQRVAEYVAPPVNVISDGNVGVPGSPNIAPVVVRAGVLADLDDSGISTIETGAVRSSSKRSAKLDFDAADEPDHHFEKIVGPDPSQL